VRLCRRTRRRRNPPEAGSGDPVDRDDITGFGAAYNDWPSDRRQGMPIASRGEWCRHRADIFDIIEGAAYLDLELIAGIDGLRWRCVGIDREEVFGLVRPLGAAPYALQTPKRNGSTGARDGAISGS
jgi:hypothetical protein